MEISICFCGDIMLGGVLPYQNDYIDKEVLSYMKGFDLRAGTLECAVGTGIQFDETKMNNTQSIIYARNEDIWRLKDLDINVVTLANNHAFDLGLSGMENTIRQLNDMNIKYCGAGYNIFEAKRPAVIEHKGRSIAFIGCMIDEPSPVIFHKATEMDYGVYQVGIEELERDIKKAKQQYNYVFVLPHWGKEHSYIPPSYCKDYAKRMVDAGADAVIGSHPHVINPVVKYKGKYVYFSLGNFLFPDKCMQIPRPMYYPETKEEYLSLKRMWTYPKSISEPIVAVWKPKNRIGMMIEMEVNDKIKSCYHLTCLTADNVLHRYSSSLVRIRMVFWAMLMHLPKYNIILYFYNHRYNILRRLVDKLPAFNIPVKL